MNYILSIPDQLQAKYREGKIQIYLNNKFHLSAIQPIIFQPKKGRFHLIFIPCQQLFKNFDNHLKIPSNKKKAICLNLRDCNLQHRMYLGYFMIQYYHSFLKPDFLEGNIIKNIGKGYLIISSDELSISTKTTPWNTVFYRFKGSQIYFYKGKINYEENKQFFFKNQNGKIKISDKPSNVSVDYELIDSDKFYFKDINTGLYFYWQNQFRLSQEKDDFQVGDYEHLKIKLPFRYFGFDDNSNKIFGLFQNLLWYDGGQQIEIDVDENHELLLYLNENRIKLKLKDGKLIQDENGQTLYLNLENQTLFTLQFSNGKYLNYVSGNFQQSLQPCQLRNKPNGYYIFHSSQIYKCLSSFDLSILQNRFIDSQYAFYFSIEQMCMYLNGYKIYIDDMYKLTYSQSNKLQIQYAQDSVFIYCLISGNKKYLTYIPSYETYKFTSTKESDFYYSDVKDLNLKYDQFYQITFKQLYLNKNSFLFQTIQIRQKFRDIWQIYGNNFVSLSSYVITGNPILGVKINQNPLSGQPFFYQESWVFKISNIKQQYSNMYSCDLNLQTNVYFDEDITGKVKKFNNYLSIQGEEIKIYFHKIPCKLSLPVQFSINGIGLDNKFLKGPFITSFRQIGKNLYIPTFPNTGQYMVVYWNLSPNGYWRVFKVGNIYQKSLTFSIQQYDGNSIFLKIRSWKSMNGQAYLYNPDIGSQTILAQIPWRIGLYLTDQ